MLPPQPHASLPTPQNFTRHALSRPFSRRNFDIGLSPSKFTYCTHSATSCTVPLPTFAARYGSAPNNSHMLRKSCVPNELSSVTPPHHTFTIFGRFDFSPMPSFQWYVSAKQPPGQRSTGIFNFFKASITSL